MFKGAVIGQYIPGNSSVHHLDPRTKILITLAMIILTFQITGLIGYLLMFLFVFGAAYLSHISLRYMLKGIKPILVIVVLTVLLNIFFVQGETVVLRWKLMTITLEGIKTSVYMALRLTLLVVSTQLMTLTTSPISLTNGLETLLKPADKIKLPVHELTMIMTIALRFIPTLLEETDKIMKAQMARGADFESGNLIRRAKAMVPLLVPLFVGALRRADDLSLAMEARCYHGGENRTRMKVLRFRGADAVAGVCFALLAVLVFLERLI